MLITGKEKDESPAEMVERFPDSSGFIVGRVFSKNERGVALDAQMVDAIKRTNGSWLGQNRWGRYIAAMVDKQKRAVTFYRDPLGLLTLFYFKYAGGFLFSTDISILYDAVAQKPQLNWEYLCSFVVNPHNITALTPFQDIYELQPGCETKFSAQGIEIQQFWDPSKIRISYRTDEQILQEEIYNTFTDVTQAWCEKTEGVCVELSGGLDSSSVLAVAKDVLPKEKPLTALNFYHPAIASSNEVEEARQVADDCQVPFEAINWDLWLRYNLRTAYQGSIGRPH